jgi:hypothetical protein
MAIDPRIALGVQPIQQQPNMLAQYAQVMAIKAAQQEMESNDKVTKFFNTPEDQRGDPTSLLGSKQGRATYESLLKGRREQLESNQKRIDMMGGLAGFVRERPTIENFQSTLDQAVSYGLMTPTQRQDTLSKYGGSSESIRAYADQTFQSALTAKDRTANETRIQTANIGAGPGHRQADLAREKFEYDKANPELELVTGDTGFYGRNKRVPNSLVPLGMAPTAPPPPVAQPSAVNNLMMTTQPTPSVNALTPTAPPQNAGPTVAAAAAMDAQNNIPRPRQPIRQPVAVIKDGEVTLVSPEQAVGMTPATPGAEKALEKKTIAKEGKESVNGVLNTLYSEYSNLVKSGGVTDTRRSLNENIAARTGASGAGQLAGSFTGSESQSFRDTIEQTRPLLLTAIMKATGLSATQLNSNVELQTYLKTATDPKVSIQANVKALNNISTMFGLGEKFEVPEIIKSGSQSDGSVRVNLPDGSVFNAPNAEAAEKFKKAAGIK